MSYHAIRGESEEAAIHRERAEQLALRGGAAWSSSLTLSVLSFIAAAISEDAIGLVRAISEFERYLPIAPKLHVLKTVGEGWLEYVRGRTERGLAIVDSVIDHEDTYGVQAALLCQGLHAALLNTLGMHSRAEHGCLRVLQLPERQGEQTVPARAVKSELAVARAGLGRFAEAIALLDEQLEAALPFENPLELGSMHRARARIALLAQDGTAFDVHFTAMTGYFRTTRNPCLMAQCETLLAQAVRLGLSADRRAKLPLADADDALEGQTYVGEDPQDTYVEASRPNRHSG